MKPIIVHYINIGNLDNVEVSEYINNIKQTFTYNEEYHSIFIPIINKETYIDCLNPIVLPEEEREKYIKKIENLKKNVEEMLKEFPFLNKNELLIEKK